MSRTAYQSSAGTLAVLLASPRATRTPSTWLLSKAQAMLSFSLTPATCVLKLMLNGQTVLEQDVFAPDQAGYALRLHLLSPEATGTGWLLLIRPEVGRCFELQRQVLTAVCR